MERPKLSEHPNSQYRAYVEAAMTSHLKALQRFGMRGWATKNKGFVTLSEMEAADCSVDAFIRFMQAIDRRNPTVMQLVLDFAPSSRNTFRMLRLMFQRSAYDMFKANGREIPMGALGLTDSEDSTDDGRSNIFEKLVNDYQETNPEIDPNDVFEIRASLAKVVAKAIELNLLNKTRQFILLSKLQNRDDSDIAAELELETIQVQRHLYKIREALKSAFQALEVEA